MARPTRALLIAGIGLLGAAVFLAMTVYPFQYGPLESALLAGILVVLALFEVVLEKSSI